jgi:P-type Ca2+ transporter type 2C
LYALSGGLRDPTDAGRPAPGASLPLLPAQILWLSLLTHFFAGAAPGTEPIEIETMTAPASGPAGGCPGRWTLMAHSSGRRRACRGQPQREPGRREPARVLRRAALPRSGTVGGGWGWSGGPHHTKMPAVSRVSEPMPLALVEAAPWLAASVTITPLRSMLSTQQLPATIWGLALRSALTGQGAPRPAPAGPSDRVSRLPPAVRRGERP